MTLSDIDFPGSVVSAVYNEEIGRYLHVSLKDAYTASQKRLTGVCTFRGILDILHQTALSIWNNRKKHDLGKYVANTRAT